MEIRFAKMLVLGMLWMPLGCSDKPEPRFRASPVEEPRKEVKIDEGPRLAFNYDARMHFGLTVIKDAYGDPVTKRLTFAADGQTNSTLVQIDSRFLEFGGHEGLWAQQDHKFPNGSRSTWALRNGSVSISQVLKLVLSDQPVAVAPGVRQRILDTCLIRYEIKNIDTKDHYVGLRMVMDTMIGSNDGVPFAVPTMRGLVDTCRDFYGDDVPDFIQALEEPDLKNPGTIAHMTLRTADLEPPSRVSLTLWPGYVPFANKKWEVPLEPIRQTKNLRFPNGQMRQEKLSDSCVVLYWQTELMKPGEKRIVGFAYGLGRLSSSDPTGKLALTWNGDFEVGKEFSVTAYVKDVVQSQTLTLDLPAGLECVGGQETVLVPLPAGAKTGDTSVITWKIKASQAGKHLVTVRSSTGIVQNHEVATVQPAATGREADRDRQR